jgi:hypothetical protein
LFGFGENIREHICIKISDFTFLFTCTTVKDNRQLKNPLFDGKFTEQLSEFTVTLQFKGFDNLIAVLITGSCQTATR